MKKILLSSFVVISFFIYSIFQRKTSNSRIITPANTSNNHTIPSPLSPVSLNYKDGTYTGDVADAFYGNVQVQATISSGKITTVNFLQYPNDRGRSIAINSQAMPILDSEAISAQQANVNIVSGATDTSQAFITSLQSALVKAQ